MDRALSGATPPDQSGPGSNSNEGVLRITQSPSIAGTSLSDCLVSYTGHSLGGVPLCIAQLAGTVEYTYCTSAEG